MEAEVQSDEKQFWVLLSTVETKPNLTLWVGIVLTVNVALKPYITKQVCAFLQFP